MTTGTPATEAAVELFPSARSEGRRFAPWEMLANDVRELRRFWPVVANMVSQDIRMKYQRSVLGFFWTLLNPILMMLTISVVFSQLMQTNARSFGIFLFSGMLPWSLLAGTLTDCSYCIILNEGLIRKIYLPKLIFPLTRLLVNVTMLVLSMGALFVLMIPLGARFSSAMVMLPLAIVLFAAFSLGLGLILAVANTFYRDCGHLVTVFLQAWYFATPVLYPIKQFPAEVQWRFWLNPAFPFIRIFQLILDEGQWPDPVLFLAATGLAAACLGVGYAAFKSHEDKLVFRL